MTRYLIEMDFPEHKSTDFILRIPEQRARVEQMIKQGERQDYILNEARTKLWIVVDAENEPTAREKVGLLPLTAFSTCRVHSLLFHHSAQAMLPPVMLN